MASLQGGGGGSASSSFYRGGYASGTPGAGTYVKSSSSSRSQARSSVPKVFKKPAPAPTRTYSSQPAPRYSQPRPAVGAPSSVGRSSTGRIRPTFTAPPPAPKPPPAPPSIDQWLKSDSSYITQQSALSRALTDYIAQMNSQKAQYQGQYDLNLKDLGTQRETGFNDLENDYASRGLLKSGVYGQAYADLEKDFNARQAALDTARTNFLANLTTGQKNFQTEQQLTAEKAKQEAVARRAAKYNL